jgi:hypothetical protein
VYNAAVANRPKKPANEARVIDREFFAEAARRGWAKKTAAEKKAVASHASTAYWARLTPEERSAEMKRRAKVRAKNAKKKP